MWIHYVKAETIIPQFPRKRCLYRGNRDKDSHLSTSPFLLPISLHLVPFTRLWYSTKGNSRSSKQTMNGTLASFLLVRAIFSTDRPIDFSLCASPQTFSRVSTNYRRIADFFKVARDQACPNNTRHFLLFRVYVRATFFHRAQTGFPLFSGIALSLRLRKTIDDPRIA